MVGCALPNGAPQARQLGRAWRIGRLAVFAHDAVQPLGKFIPAAKYFGIGMQDFPGLIHKLQGFKVLGDIINAAEQAEGIMDGRQRRKAQAGCHADPGLLTGLHGNAVLNFLKSEGKRSLAAGGAVIPGFDLDDGVLLRNPIYALPGCRD